MNGYVRELGELGDRLDADRDEHLGAEPRVIELLPGHVGDAVGLVRRKARPHHAADELAEDARGRVLADHALLPVRARSREVSRGEIAEVERCERVTTGVATEIEG